jgi:hypothetical protein
VTTATPTRTLLVATLAALVLPPLLATPAAGRQSPPGSLVTIIRLGGLCFQGRNRCRSELRIGDRSITAAGYRPRHLTRRERAGLVRAIAAVDIHYLRSHPFRGTCPLAYDGQESIYLFRGFPQPPAPTTCEM